ncbi:MAG TPA: antitoxin Xre/MbcA/ParS toxin-binding domain-containing protein [Longimicrobium sp.]|nr:antitoxin Xre/MbcA/ParS toxin-binding domain-containing protein [Longimicrobium sp.]
MATALAVAELLAEAENLPFEVESDLDWIKAVKAGLPSSFVDVVSAELGYSAAEIDRLVMPRRTLAHRRANNQSLTREESDRLTRIARVALTARETFGDAQKAATWLRRPNRALQGSLPIDLLDTDDGARLVEEVLGRLAYGIFS